ncbi:MAG: hypothetical protein UU91_C0016G0003 [candidate division WWE3 bacterium GW2011_GWB1_42_117]|nr:MAG: hypothetical protein UU91_C0016G0003 [candidate division WWE3 bacterium GW2011_GWB1_42_117]
MKSLEAHKKDRITNYLIWIPGSVYTLLVLLFVPKSQMGMGEKQFIGVGVTLLCAILLLNTRPKRIVLTVLGDIFLILTGVLAALALQ